MINLPNEIRFLDLWLDLLLAHCANLFDVGASLSKISHRGCTRSLRILHIISPVCLRTNCPSGVAIVSDWEKSGSWNHDECRAYRDDLDDPIFPLAARIHCTNHLLTVSILTSLMQHFSLSTHNARHKTKRKGDTIKTTESTDFLFLLLKTFWKQNLKHVTTSKTGGLPN